ncbi:hypothetical protein B0H10DRAFT_1955125 [Mycena sp. CBHHK59/15]|nr:hypothetical protein B0H10DRAFT_1955125 [Mycena sp. CBHHK59/15]
MLLLTPFNNLIVSGLRRKARYKSYVVTGNWRASNVPLHLFAPPAKRRFPDLSPPINPNMELWPPATRLLPVVQPESACGPITSTVAPSAYVIALPARYAVLGGGVVHSNLTASLEQFEAVSTARVAELLTTEDNRATAHFASGFTRIEVEALTQSQCAADVWLGSTLPDWSGLSNVARRACRHHCITELCQVLQILEQCGEESDSEGIWEDVHALPAIRSTIRSTVSPGVLTGTARRAHGNGVLPASKKHCSKPAYQEFCRQMYHASLARVFELKAGMTTPVWARTLHR